MRRIPVLIAALALLLTVQAAGDQSCARCGKAITVDYLEFEGRPYCSQKCFEAALPRCAVCGRPVGEGVKRGEFIRAEGKVYCSEACFERSLPKCSACGRPARRQLRPAGDSTRVFCSPECYQTSLPKCRICARPLQNWSEIGRQIFCSDCAGLPRCLNCLLPGAQTELPDGRHICGRCLPRAVAGQEQGQQLFDQVRRDMGSHLKLSTRHRITFRLVDAAQLREITGVQVFAEQGLYSHRWKTYQQTKAKVAGSDTFVIYILSHLDPDNFRSIAAHELAHDLHGELFPRAKGRELEEGFAEYLSSLMNSHWGCDSLNRGKLDNQEKAYSQGYRSFLKIADPGGLAAVLAYMENQDRAERTK
jgi:endogenous inhibitor of DNA gyrase (YacG/DUF329 family)